MLKGPSTPFSNFYNPSTLLSNYNLHSEPTYYLTHISTTERLLVLNSIRMILGYPNQIYKYSEQQGFFLTDIVNMKHLTPQVLIKIATSLIQCANRIQFLKNKVRELRKCEGVVLQELLNAIENFLKEVTRFFTELNIVAEFQAGRVNKKDAEGDISQAVELTEPLTLIKLSLAVQEKMERIDVLVGLVTKVGLPSKTNPNYSLVVLNSLWELLERFESLELNSPMSQLILSLLIEPVKRYLELVQGWFGDTMKNQIETAQEFFIKRAGEGYTMSPEETPEMLRDVGASIFSYGKFIKVIYCFANEEDIMNINEFMNSKHQFQHLFSLLDAFILHKEVKVPIKHQERRFHSISSMIKERQAKAVRIEHEEKELPYGLHVSILGVFEINRFPSPKPQVPFVPEQRQVLEMQSLFLSEFRLRFETHLNHVLENIRGKCSDYFNFKQILPPFHTIPQLINNHLFCIRSFILFQQGDFIQQLIENIGEQLQKPTSIIQENLISDLLQTTLLNSNSKFLPPQLLKNLHFRFLSKNSQYSGWDMFYLEYRLSPPLHHLFPPQVMNRYNIVFNFIWRLKHIQYLLKQIFYENKEIKETKNQYETKETNKETEQKRNYYLFRNALNLFSNTITSDIILKVKDEWDRFMTSLEGVESLEEFIDLHRQLVGNLEGITFINSKERQIHLRLENITQIIMKVKELLNKDVYICERDKQREIKNLSEEFKLRVKDLLYVNHSFTVDVVDFTGFYE